MSQYIKLAKRIFSKCSCISIFTNLLRTGNETKSVKIDVKWCKNYYMVNLYKGLVCWTVWGAICWTMWVTIWQMTEATTKRKSVLKICSKFTGKHPCRRAISIKLLCNFIEIAPRHGFSPVNLLHIFGIPFLKNTSGWLLLKWRFKHVRIMKE